MGHDVNVKFMNMVEDFYNLSEIYDYAAQQDGYTEDDPYEMGPSPDTTAV